MAEQNHSLAVRIVWFSSAPRPGSEARLNMSTLLFVSMSISKFFLALGILARHVLENTHKISARIEGIGPALAYSKYQYSVGGHYSSCMGCMGLILEYYIFWAAMIRFSCTCAHA